MTRNEFVGFGEVVSGASDFVAKCLGRGAPMSARSIRGKVAIAGIGESTYYKHGQSPDAELVLLLQAILRAAEDAGIEPHEIDGFASYSNDRNDPSRIAAALGIPDLRFSNMHWGGGGGGVRPSYRCPRFERLGAR